MKTLKQPLFFIVILFSILLETTSIFAQAPAWLWAQSSGGERDDKGNSVATDASGNIYVTGVFRSNSITFGSITLNNFTIDGSDDMFIVKYAPNGQILWAKSAGGSSGEEGNGVTIDKKGNVYVTGYFESPSIIFETTTLNNPNGTNRNIFLVKYDSNGNELWVKSAGGMSPEEGVMATTDLNGNIFVTGFFYSASLSFGSITLINADPFANNMFIAKYDPDGNVLWARSTDGSIEDETHDAGRSITTDVSGNAYVTGYFNDSILTLGTITLRKALIDKSDMFIVKYDPNGNVLWAKSFGGNKEDFGNSITTGDDGNIYVLGSFNSDTISFGTTTLQNTSSFRNDIFIIKSDLNGNILWAKSAGGSFIDQGSQIAADSNGYLYITGHFLSPTITFGTFTLNNIQDDAHGNDIFIVKYDPDGNVIWAKSSGGTGMEYANSISAGSNGNVYITGSFDNLSTTFDATTLNNVKTGYDDILIAKLNADPTSISEESITKKALNISPNPSKGIVTLQFAFFENIGQRKIRIYNSLGIILKTFSVESLKEIRIDCSDLSNGLYYAEVSDSDGFFAHTRFILTQ